MRETLRDGLIICCIVAVIVGGLAFLTMGPEIKAATNAGCTQRGWRPVFEEPEPELNEWHYEIPLRSEQMATVTGITDDWSASGTLELIMPASITDHVQIDIGFAGFGFTLLSSSSTQMYFMPEPEGPAGTEIFTVASGETYELPFKITLTNAHLGATCTGDAIGEKGVTHAKEAKLEEKWYLTAETQVVVECGDFETYTYSWTGETGSVDEAVEMLAISVTAGCSDWTNDTVHIAVRDIAVSSLAVNCSELDDTWGSSVNLRVQGSGADIELWRSAYVSSAWHGWSGKIYPPRAYSFKGLDVIDRDGNSHSDALVWNSGVREWDGEGNPICPVCKTVAQWQAYDHTQARGCYSWDTGDPDLNAIVTLYIDRDWAREAGLDGFTSDEYATKSFGHDARIIIDGWTIDKTSRDCSPYNAGILSIAHKTSQGIYADNQDHTDWTSNGNCSDPDGDGDFTVTFAGAVQTLSLKNNREARLGGLVQALQAPAGVPDAYITYQHDYYLTADNYPETTHESIYCWKGWRYLYQQVRPPIGSVGQTAQVVIEIDYYDSETHSDPHVSDSTRQTDYSYSLGPLHTRTFIKQVPRTELYTNLCFDLGDLQPMLIVKAIRLKVEQVGTWSLDEPRLALDTGDVLAEREFVSPHCYAKEFEHWAYRRGGISAVVDGVARGSIEWPDTSHENTIEHTGGHFDYVVGATSGIDFTSACSLATYAGWINKCSDAWNAVVNSGAELAATSDGTNTLKTLSAYDLLPVNCLTVDSAGMDVAIRVGTFTAAPGIHYTFHAEKITGGAAHGCLFVDAGREASAFANLLRRVPGEDWAIIEEGLNTDGHGYWATGDMRVYVFDEDGVGVLYDYALERNGLITGLGRMATREWVVSDYDFPVQLRGRQPALCLSPDGTIFLVSNDGKNNIEVHHRSSPLEPWVYRGTVWADANHHTPAIAALLTGILRVSATLADDSASAARSSNDGGETWA